MKLRVVLLRITLLIAAIADAYVAIKLLLVPYGPGIQYKPEMETIASLMIGWTLLLVWASIKPIERKFILLLTIIMMTIGRIIELFAIINNKIVLTEIIKNTLPTIVLLAFFIIMYVVSTIRSKEPMEKNAK